MARALYLEPFGGLAGDMLLAALLDLGRPELTLELLSELAEHLVPGEAVLRLESVRRRGLRASWLDVRTPESRHAPHRHLADLEELLARVPLEPATAARAARVLRRIAEAEARIHDVDVEEVHFHEVGAVDTLIDVAGACFALERLGVEQVLASRPYVGGGTVDCAHGTLPVPAPATAELLRGRAFDAGPGGERVTPTGAALLAELAPAGVAPAGFAAEAIGYGAGSRDPDEGPPNLVRVQLGRLVLPGSEGVARTRVSLVELQLDDATGEEVAFLLEELRAAGVLDAWTQAVQMKKGRPGVLVSFLCREERREELAALVFRHAPTLGLRWSEWERLELARDVVVVALHGESVRVKRRRGGPPGPFDLSPEHEDLARLARRTGRPLRELEAEAIAAARAAAGGREGEPGDDRAAQGPRSGGPEG